MKYHLNYCTFGGDTSVTSARASLGLRPFLDSKKQSEKADPKKHREKADPKKQSEKADPKKAKPKSNPKNYCSHLQIQFLTTHLAFAIFSEKCMFSAEYNIASALYLSWYLALLVSKES